MANRTALFNRAQPGGVFTVSDIVEHPGDIWFVDSGIGVDGAGYGQNPDAPCATWNYAYDLATAAQGDVIYLMPGHTEVILNATTIVPDKAGITTIGLGRGMNRPIIDFNHANAKITISGDDQRFSNIVFRSTITGVTLGLEVTADDIEIDNCFFTWETTGDEFLTTMSVTAKDRLHVHDCVFDSETAGGATHGISLVDTEDTTIERNIFRGAWSAAAIFGLTTLSKRLLILDNVIYNSDVTPYNAIDPGAVNTTGIVAGNTITSLYPSPLTKVIVASHLTWHNNTFANTIAERGPNTVPTASSV
jgi:hypothetical protein